MCWFPSQSHKCKTSSFPDPPTIDCSTSLVPLLLLSRDPTAPRGVSSETIHPVALAKVTTEVSMAKPDGQSSPPFPGPISSTCLSDWSYVSKTPSLFSSWIPLFLVSLSLFFWPCFPICRILVPQPGIEPGAWQWKHQDPTTGLPWNSLYGLFFFFKEYNFFFF